MYKSIDSTRIRNLKVVAKLKQGERLRTRSHYYSIEPYYSPYFSFRPLVRMVYGEGKTETTDSLSRLVESCVLQAGMAHEDKMRLTEQLKEVIKGINNLAVTYKEDSGAVSGLEYVKEVAEDFIVQYDPDYVRETRPTRPSVVRDVPQERDPNVVELEEEEVSD